MKKFHKSKLIFVLVVVAIVGPASDGVPYYERAPARAKRVPAVACAEGAWDFWRVGGGRGVCGPSGKCSVGGLDRRAKEHPVHDLFPA